MYPYTTGLAGLDAVFDGILPGDNLVFEVDGMDDYRRFVLSFAEGAAGRGKEIVYFRFAGHGALLEADGAGGGPVRIVPLDPRRGFEYFVADLVEIVRDRADSAWFVFDCLSGLVQEWYSDRMMANFFLIVCPFVLKLKSLAFFSLYKQYHSAHALDSIYHTAQIISEVWSRGETCYLQPRKVDGRHSATMYMLHRREGELFIPVTNSARIADVAVPARDPLLSLTIRRSGLWDASYREGAALLAARERGEAREEETEALFERLLRMAITRQQSFLPLARRYFDIPCLLDLMKRLVGSGLIGGKARGILLARRILREKDPRWEQVLENHDSFFIGSDVFYTYIIQNGCWWLRQWPGRKTSAIGEILEKAAAARERILRGEFLDYIVVQFQEMLEYFGQSPIIVRSSSIQEDSYGNAFSGKYESVFCANQGSPEERLAAFLDAVRTVYASSMSEDALLYRLHHGLLFEDEQMALLVQRVSGDRWGDWFFPPAGGVGFSYNPFAWDPSIDPRAGVLRVVLGLGTRAVDRIDDDYTRIVALNQPLKGPEKNTEDARRYIQRKADIIDLGTNRFTTVPVRQALEKMPQDIQDLFSSTDPAAAARARELGLPPSAARSPDFTGLFEQTGFCARMRDMLETLEAAYEHPVDVEFTLNMDNRGGVPSCRINLVQCRPFKVKILGAGDIGQLPSSIPRDRIFIRSDGPIVGRSMAAPVDRLIYVSPEAYTALGEQERYGIARLVGNLSRRPTVKKAPVIMVVGPGRWGTSTPAMGIPVSFHDIKGVSVLVELAIMHAGLVPDVSLGTHFFNDLVEMDMLYFAVFPGRGQNCFSEGFLRQAPAFLDLVPPENDLWARAVTVLEQRQGGGSPEDTGGELRLYADAASQTVLCYTP